MSTAGDRALDVPSAELAGIVLRAGRLGFPRWRVAIALGISAHGLAAIEQNIGVTGGDGCNPADPPFS